MRTFVLGLVVGSAATVAASALAVTHGGSTQLTVGDRAALGEGMDATTCVAVSKRGTPTLSCFVGDDQYRKRFSVSINPDEVTVSQYFGVAAAKPYRVIFRRPQTPTYKAYGSRGR